MIGLVRRCWLTVTELRRAEPLPNPAPAPQQQSKSESLPHAPHGFLVQHNRAWREDDPMSWTELVPRTLADCSCQFCIANHVHHPWVPR